MKKVILCLPAAVYTIAGIVLNIVLQTISPLWYVWMAFLWLGSFLLSRGKAWGGLFGLLPAIHILYMSTQYTGQIVNIEMPLGIGTALYVLGCSLWIWTKGAADRQKETMQ